jgi:hypothetical protein
MSNDTKIDEAIVRAGSVDYLDLWFVTRLIAELLGESDQITVREVALDAIERLARAGRVRVGDLVPPGEFIPWGVDIDAAVHRVRREAHDLDRPLNVGDIAWLEVL